MVQAQGGTRPFLSGEASCGFSLIVACSKFNLCTRGALPHIRSSICLKYQRDDVESSYSPGNRDATDLKVWKAKEPGSDIVVALKMIKATDKEGNSCDVSCLLCMAAPSYRFFLCHCFQQVCSTTVEQFSTRRGSSRPGVTGSMVKRFMYRCVCHVASSTGWLSHHFHQGNPHTSNPHPRQHCGTSRSGHGFSRQS